VRAAAPGHRVYAVPVEAQTGPEPLAPITADGRSGNELRPRTLDEMIGQEALKPLLRRLIESARASGRPMDHMLLIGGAGTGKSTVANVIANEIGRPTFQLKAPVDLAMFERLRISMKDGDVLYVDEIHQQVAGDRRGTTQACDPETFFHVMEDRRLALPGGVMDFPHVTIIGATTDTGLLPAPFLDRFPLRPRLLPYTVEEMTTLALANARALGLEMDTAAAALLAGACRGVPRLLNSYVRNCSSLTSGAIGAPVALEVVTVLNSTTPDGLDLDMQRLLIFLLERGERVVRGETHYIAGMNTIATALGKSRDQKAVALYVEPYLISRGLLAVGHGGRELTPAGITRARELTTNQGG
jgi:Holliday junction DNA helicase RuvB